MENQQRLLGHPKGLFYLFFAELWERFSFYGMRALLTLYMVKELFNDIANGEEISYGIYAAYGALVYATPTIGGRIADQIIGYRKSIILGGLLMSFGHFMMAFENDFCFYGALGLLIIGNGFFKPNISTMVGSLYEQGDAKRDSGFTIFYMGINVGAMAAPLVCGWLGASYGWHYGFAAAGIGMLIGLVCFWSGLKANVFGDRGLQPETYKNKKIIGIPVDIFIYISALLSVPIFALLILNNNLDIFGSELMSVVLVGLLAIILTYVIYVGVKTSKIEAQRLVVLMVLILFNMVFWSFFEQAGSSLVLFAERNVNLTFLNAAQTNAINPTFIMLFAIPFSLMWVWLAKFRANPSSPLKFALGLAQLGAGFLIFAYSANFMDGAGKVPFMFLVLGWLIATSGELFLSPIGLSKVTELAPAKMVAFLMGVYFLSTAFSHHIAGQIAKLTTVSANKSGDNGGFMTSMAHKITGLGSDAYDSAIGGVQTLAAYTSVFAQIAIVAFGVALVALILTPLLRKWMHGVH